MRSLRLKLLLATIAVQVVVIVALLVAGHRLIHDVLMADIRRDARTIELLLATALAPQVAERDYAALRDIARESAQVIGLTYLVLHDVDGRTLAAAGALPDGGRVRAAPANHADLVAQEGAFHIAAPIRLGARPYGRMHFGIPEERLAAGERYLTLQTVAIGGVGIVASALLLLLFTGVLTRGLRELSAATEKLGAGQYDIALPVRGADEVARLTTTFNDMSRALAERVAALRDSQAQLQRMNAELEERVAARTHELVTARDAAERASRAKSEFLSRMSHELRTPLNAILGFAQVLQLTAATLTPRSREQLREIEAAGWHLLELINEVLDLSRIESGAMTVSREPVELAPLAAECARMAAPLAHKHGVRIVDLAIAAPGVHALGDRTRLKQVLTNLLSNAIKYNRAGGSVTLSIRRTDDDRVELAVADTGRGITEAQLGRLFRPFDRLDAEGGPVDGTGIGLVITKRLVELMGGTLHVDTQAGTGSVFTARLQQAQPSADAVAAAPPAAAGQPPAHEARTVLYIEDNPSNVDLLAGVLALRPGLQLVAASDGAAGIELARRLRPDLIVVDVALPGIDGFEVCRRLRADAAFARAPIVALSANAMASDLDKGRRAGFDAYLTKPLDVPTFLAEVDRLLGTERALR